MTNDFRIAEAQRIRLRLLQALAKQPGGTWTVAMLMRELQLLGYRKSETFVINQLNWLESEALAVRLIDDMVVSILIAGRQHLDGSKSLSGVDEPAEES